MKYFEKGEGKPLVLLHGLFGSLSNWEHQIEAFSRDHWVIVPELDFNIPRSENAFDFLARELQGLLLRNQLEHAALAGNSLGGHLALVFAHRYPHMVSKLVLTGSSGLFENMLGGSYPKRNSRRYIKERVEYTFYDPKVATEGLLAEVYDTVNDNAKCFHIIRMAKEAQRNTLRDILPWIQVPTLLIWGKNDRITPPKVALEFHGLLKDSELHWIDKCGHAPMMEHPATFNGIMKDFFKADK